MLVSQDSITKVDQARLHLIYEKWPDHLREASKILCRTDHEPEYYRSITLCGMGGSATSCDIINDLFHFFSNHPCTVNRGQRLSPSIDKHSLVVVNSVSGNTEEVLLMFKEASARNAEVISISAGGRLKELAASYGNKHINIPNLSLPRASLPYLLMPGFRLVEPFLGISIDYKHISENLRRVVKQVSASVPYEINVAKKISSFLNEGFAFCLTSPSLSSVSRRFKNSLNENAKVHGIHESILESSHNEIVPFTFENECPSRKILSLRWVKDVPIVNERFSKVNALLSQIGLPFMEIHIQENNWIDAVLSSIYILDYSTIYIAVSRNVDPSATPAIDILKS